MNRYMTSCPRPPMADAGSRRSREDGPLWAAASMLVGLSVSGSPPPAAQAVLFGYDACSASGIRVAARPAVASGGRGPELFPIWRAHSSPLPWERPCHARQSPGFDVAAFCLFDPPPGGCGLCDPAFWRFFLLRAEPALGMSSGGMLAISSIAEAGGVESDFEGMALAIELAFAKGVGQ